MIISATQLNCRHLVVGNLLASTRSHAVHCITDDINLIFVKHALGKATFANYRTSIQQTRVAYKIQEKKTIIHLFPINIHKKNSRTKYTTTPLVRNSCLTQFTKWKMPFLLLSSGLRDGGLHVPHSSWTMVCHPSRCECLDCTHILAIVC